MIELFGLGLGLVYLIVLAFDVFFNGLGLHSTISAGVVKFSKVEAFSPAVIALIFVALALTIGGASVYFSTLSFGGSDVDQNQIGAAECQIVKARLLTIGDGNSAYTNATYTADSADLSNYFVDTYNGTTYISSGIDLNGTLDVWVENAPATGEECNAVVYLAGPSYKSQLITGAGANDVYELIDVSLAQSEVAGVQPSNRVDAVRWNQVAYLQDEAIATTGSSQEIGAVNYAASEVHKTVGFAIDFNSAAYDQIKKNNQVQILFKQQTGGAPSSSDPTIYTITVRKGVLG